MAVDLSKLPAVLPGEVARTQADGKPTKYQVDWEGLQRYFFATTVTDLDNRVTGAQSTAEGASAAVLVEATTRAAADSAMALQISTVDATANSATANGAIYFGAASVPAGATAAYGLYLTAGNAGTGMELYAHSGGTSSIAFLASKFSLTDSGTAENVFSYSSGVFTFNVPIFIGTVDISTQAVYEPTEVSNGTPLSLAATGGVWTTLYATTVTASSGDVAFIYADFIYRMTAGTGTLSHDWRLLKNGTTVMRGWPLTDFTGRSMFVGVKVIDTSMSGSNTYAIQIKTSTTGTLTIEYDNGHLLIDLRKR